METFKVDKRTNALVRLYVQKLHDSHEGRPNNRIIDIENYMEHRRNGTKGQLAVCAYFKIPFHWIVLPGVGDGGVDIKINDLSIEVKNSGTSPEGNGCYIPLPSGQKITADYVVGTYGIGLNFQVYGWLTNEEFYRLKEPIPQHIMKNQPPGVHSRFCHPMDQLQRKVLDIMAEWGNNEWARLEEYEADCAITLAKLEAELDAMEPQEDSVKPHWVDTPNPGGQPKLL